MLRGLQCTRILLSHRLSSGITIIPLKSRAMATYAFDDPTSDSARYDHLLVTFREGVRTICFNRPKQKNALNEKMFEEIVLALQEAADDPKTIITTTTGSGNVYTAGNDQNNFRNLTLQQTKDLLARFIAAFVDFPKPLVAVVNGAAVGVGTTWLPLYDTVFATEKAVFFAPFSALGLTAEACSTYTFPKFVSPGHTTELLLFNKKIGATEAYKLGLVTEVFSDATFHEDVQKRLLERAKLPLKSLVYTKALTRAVHRENLHKVNVAEMQRVTERLGAQLKPDTQEYKEFVMKNFDRQS